MAEIGLFDENIFEVTFRKANEEKQLNPNSSCSSSSLRRTISIQNEDTLHTPQIPLHLYKSETSIVETPPLGQDNLIPEESPSKKAKRREESPVVKRNRRPGRSRKSTNLDTLLPPPNLTTINTAPIPIAFPDAIQIKPKWTVVLQYPSFDQQATQPSTAKERLKTLLVKNESSTSQTITLTPPIKEPVVDSPIGLVGKEIVPPLNKPVDPPVPPTSKKVIKTPSALERNNAATKRYRNKRKEFVDSLTSRNNQLEEENRKLRMENRMLHGKIQELLDKEGRSRD